MKMESDGSHEISLLTYLHNTQSKDLERLLQHVHLLATSLL